MKHRIVVVGGGITGAFSAYFLARLGAEVTVVERDQPAGGASGHNAGGLNPLHGPGIPGAMMQLALDSLSLHIEHGDEIQRRSRIGFGHACVPRLHIAMDQSEAAQLAEREELYNATGGLSARFLSVRELRRAEPRVAADAEGALRTEGNVRIDPGLYTRAVLAAAVSHGARHIRGTARGLRHEGGAVTGVLVDSMVLSCTGVVIATGPWCEEPSRWLGLKLAVEPLKGELLMARTQSEIYEVEITWDVFGIHRACGRRILLGGTEDRAGFDAGPTESARTRILAGIRRLLPGLGEIRVEDRIAGLRPVTPDGFPILGIAPGWANVCLALGSGRKGMLLGAGLGCATAELMVRGETAMAVDPCTPSRWELVA